MSKTYTRKLSTTEIKEGFIMILKDKLAMFPDPGRTFSLKVGKKQYHTNINAVACLCQGPDKPHCHYHLDAREFITRLTWDRPTVTITRVEDDLYKLESN